MMDSKDEISITEYQALAEFRYELRRFLRFSEQAARAAGFEPQQHQLLLAIKGLPEGKQATISALAERLQIAHHSTVELIDRLVERGFIQRCRGESDQRWVLVRLTPQGEEALRNLSLAHRAELRSAGPALVQTLTLLLSNMNT
ncbi:MAG TPA: MarR family transcriptional regulator [Ktedonobacter sp.]|jgi:DNA-binding MarR family transcriptional regulator|nr:MarR family transcriptional regulator [Ktedonobacter sp.]